jgi:glycosyltransferase involved in cell wall biosynthesis
VGGSRNLRRYGSAVKEILVSVVVPTRDRSQMLETLLESLGRQTLDPSRFEVVVVDDGSTDGTPALLQRVAGEVRYDLRVVRHSGSGPASARNRGWRHASAPLIAFTDDDCVATPTWLQQMVESAKNRPGAIVQGATEVDPAEAPRAGPFSRTLEIKEPGPFYATCNMLYARELLERLGGFDETFPLPGGEDTDLGWRARKSGADYVFVREAVIQHAVVQLGPVGKLRWVLHWSDTMQVLRRHPGLRSNFTWGIFWKRSHALLVLAIAGAVLSRRLRPAALLALPYLRMLRARCIIEGYSLGYVPYLAVYDLAELLAAARGSARYRVLVL